MAILNKEATSLLGLFSLLLLIQKGNAYNFGVGGTSNWGVPADPSIPSYNQWAERSRFQIGDTLLFVYPGDKDSVLSVKKEDYENCNTNAPIEKYSDGHTVFKFNHSGPFYFISGVEENCHKNEKLVVVVMADRSNRSTSHGNNSTPASPPSPTAEVPPPSPAPSGEESPSPPEESSPAPSQESSPPKNSASSKLISFVGSMAAFMCSSILLVS